MVATNYPYFVLKYANQKNFIIALAFFLFIYTKNIYYKNKKIKNKYTLYLK